MAEKRRPVMSLLAFSQVIGVDVGAVNKAIRSGRLDHSLCRDSGGRAKIADLELAKQEWHQNRVRESPKSPPEGPQTPPGATIDRPAIPGQRHSLWDVRKRLLAAQARRVETENRKRARELVSAREVDLRWSALVVAARTRALSLPSRIKQHLPHLTASDLVEIDRLIREVLEELASERALEEEHEESPEAGGDEA